MVKKFLYFFRFFFFFFFTAAGLCFGLENAAVLKSPNSEPERYSLSNPNTEAG
jgi:hypothetical protein